CCAGERSRCAFSKWAYIGAVVPSTSPGEHSPEPLGAGCIEWSAAMAGEPAPTTSAPVATAAARKRARRETSSDDIDVLLWVVWLKWDEGAVAVSRSRRPPAPRSGRGRSGATSSAAGRRRPGRMLPGRIRVTVRRGGTGPRGRQPAISPLFRARERIPAGNFEASQMHAGADGGVGPSPKMPGGGMVARTLKSGSWLTGLL